MENMEKVKDEAYKAAKEILEKAKLEKGDLFVVGCSTSEVCGETIGTHSKPELADMVFGGIYEATQEYGVYLVLKGHRTVVAAPDRRVAVNSTGNSGMAKGGSGDVLAGMILSLLGQGCKAFDACCAGVWLHGRAGDRAAADKGERGMTPTDLLEQIPYAMKEI